MSSEITAASGLAGRYATALLDLAEGEKVVDAVADDLKGLQVMLDVSEDLTRLIRSPVISRADQLKAITAVMDKAGMNALTKRFIGVVANNRRLFALSSVIKAFLSILSQRRGEVNAVVTSASELSEKQVKELAHFYTMAVDREVRMKELKKEIAKLKDKLAGHEKIDA